MFMFISKETRERMKANNNGQSIDLEIEATLDARQKTKTRRQNDIKTTTAEN